MPVDFVETPADEINDILSLNIDATLRVTSAIAPGMVLRYVPVGITPYERHSDNLWVYVLRHRGLILNLGSFAGAAPAPMLATYSASKAFLATWSDALAAELGPKGVVVEHSNTYFVVCYFYLYHSYPCLDRPPCTRCLLCQKSAVRP